MWRSTEFRLEPGFFLLLALAAALGALEVLPVLLTAAACHEGAHLALLRWYRVPVRRVSLTAAGIEIQAPMQARLSYPQEIAATAAGPACNLLLALIAARWAGWYLFAGANFLLGIFNLLPVLTLDGGHICHLVLSWLFEPVTADRVCRRISAVTAWTLTILLGVLLVLTGQGLLLLLGAAGLALGSWQA